MTDLAAWWWRNTRLGQTIRAQQETIRRRGGTPPTVDSDTVHMLAEACLNGARHRLRNAPELMDDDDRAFIATFGDYDYEDEV